MADQSETQETKQEDGAPEEQKEQKRDHSRLMQDNWDPPTDATDEQVEAEKKYIRAAHLFDKGDIDEALMLIRASLALCPSNPKYHYNIAFLYWKKDLLEVAINHYKLFLRYAPANDKEIPIIKDRVKFIDKEIKKRQKPR